MFLGFHKVPQFLQQVPGECLKSGLADFPSRSLHFVIQQLTFRLVLYIEAV
jgi:hypothetical protein